MNIELIKNVDKVWILDEFKKAEKDGTPKCLAQEVDKIG
jgi:hypothetical protein